MSAYGGAVDNEAFHVWIIYKMLMHSFPYISFTPASKALIDAVPVAILLGQQSPLGTAPRHPEDGFNEASAIGLPSNVDAWAGAQELKDFRQLVISEFNISHISIMY